MPSWCPWHAHKTHGSMFISWTNMHVLILVRLNKNWYLGYHEYHVYIKINSSSVKVATEFEPRHDKTNKVSMRPAKTQINLGVRPVWSESSLSAWRKSGSLATHLTQSEDSDQTGRMPRLIWVFAGRTVTLLVLTCRDSFNEFSNLTYVKPKKISSRWCQTFYACSFWPIRKNANEPPHDKINKMNVRPTKSQISLGIRPVWSESSLSALRKLGSLATHWAHSEDTDQTGRMSRLIWVFAGRTWHFVGFVTRRLKYSLHCLDLKMQLAYCVSILNKPFRLLI